MNELHFDGHNFDPTDDDDDADEYDDDDKSRVLLV